MIERLNSDDVAALQIAALRAQLATQEADCLRLRVFVRYHLRPEDGFDLNTGVITRTPPAEPAAESAGG